MRIARASLINLLGSIVPLGVMIITVPLYLNLIGEVRFGVLAIIWLLLGYFAVFDMGLGRATTKYIAAMDEDRVEQRSTVFWGALLANIGFGVIGGLLLWSAGELFLGEWLHLEPQQRLEVDAALPWIGGAVPLATVLGVLTGALEGRQEFFVVNSLQIVSGVLFRIIPLGYAYIFGPALEGLIVSSIAVQLVTVVIMFAACVRYLPIVAPRRTEWAMIKRMLSFGGWVTVSGLLSPLLVSLDRFVIAAISGMVAVTHYTIPFNIVTRLLVVPSSVTRALFPHFSRETGVDVRVLAEEGLVVLGIVMTPLVVMCILWLRPAFVMWLGTDVGGSCASIGQVLVVGMWTNCLAQVPHALLQGQGRPDLVAKVHALEIVPFAIILWGAVSVAGVYGAAAAWGLRSTIDAFLLTALSKIRWRALRPLVPAIAFVMAAFAAVGWSDPTMAMRGVITAIILVLTAYWGVTIRPQLYNQFRAMFRPSGLT